MDKYGALFAQGGFSLDRLQTLCRVAEAGSLTAAAGGDTSRVSLYSRQLKELENFFGARLVTRVGRRLSLTEAGTELARLGRRQFAELADFAQRCRGSGAKLTLGTGASVMEWLLTRELPLLRRALPRTRITLLRGGSEYLAKRLLDLRLDVAIVREDVVKLPLQSEALFSFGYTLFVPEKLAGPARTVRSWLPKVPMMAPADGWTRTQFDAMAAREKLKLRIHVEGASAQTAIRAVREGHYAAMLPDLALQELHGARVVALRPRFLETITRRLCVAWHPRLAEARPVILQGTAALRQIFLPMV